MVEAALRLERVSRRYGEEAPVHALKNIDLRIERGDWVAIEGPSGSGKSTLLNILGCLDRPTSGSYFFKGLDVGALDDRQRGGLRSRHIAFVFQSFHLLAHRTVVENVMLAEVYQHGSRRLRRERAEAILARVGLAHRLDHYPSKLSGGERQRVAIARALFGSRDVLLCDEPTGNLDTATSLSIMELLAGLHDDGLTIVMITHSPELAQMASRQVGIVDGELYDGSPSPLPDPEPVEREESAVSDLVHRWQTDTFGLAASVFEGTQLWVPPRGRAGAITSTVSNGDSDEPVELNSATPDQLEQLPGIGQSTAAAIVAHRDEFGPFAEVDDLLAVRGIAETRLSTFGHLLSVAPGKNGGGPGPDGPGHELVLAPSIQIVSYEPSNDQTGSFEESGEELTSVDPPDMSVADLADEASAGLFARPGRTVLTVLGTVIGLAALVATLGLSSTASNRIVGRFDELAATEIVVSSRPSSSGVSNDIPWDAAERLNRLDGVVAAGTISSVEVGNVLISTAPVSDPARRTDFDLAVQALSPTAFPAVRAKLSSGRFFDAGFSDRADRVAVLGRNAAERLSVVNLSTRPAIRIGDEVYTVIGIISEVGRQHDLLGTVVIPEGTARELYRLRAPELVVVETALGANDLITEQIPLALRPDNDAALKVVSPPDQQRVRDAVESDLNLLFVVLGAVSLLVGAIGIANVTLVSVMERTGEIGLRRALGASRLHVAAQFLLESGTIGFVGGIIGASAGILIVVSVSAYQSWTPVLDLWLAVAAPLVGGLIGLLAGTYPASRAARLEPVEALRSST